MKPTTLEWIDKAEGDYVIAQTSYRARKSPNFDASCFHAQQCAEKYLKARLEEAGLAVSEDPQLICATDVDSATRAILEFPCRRS